MIPEASERLSVARHNQQHAWMYENAKKFVAEGDLSSAKQQLTSLWQSAPYYGDPLDLAKRVRLPKPPHYEEAKVRSEKTRKTSERHENRSKFIRILETNTGFLCFCIFCLLAGLGATAGITINVINAAQHTQNFIESLIWATATVVLVALLSYISGYHKAINLFTMVCMTIVSIVAACGVAWYTLAWNYTILNIK